MVKIDKCPDKPNCVSSVERKDSSKYTNPFPIKSNIEISKVKVKDICLNKLKAKLIREEKDYLHFIFTTPIFRFKDDVKFEFKKDTINVKSSSRVGYSDLGVNRKRINKIRELYG